MAAEGICPGTLKAGFSGYSPRTIKDLFGGKTMPVQFPFQLPAGPGRYPLKIVKRKFVPSDEPAELHIELFEEDDRAANQHLSLQMASQLFHIPIIPSALSFLSDGRIALLTKSLPVTGDMLQLANLDGHVASVDAHYRYSYHDISKLMDKYFAAPIPAKELLFKIVSIHYMIHNGEGHLKEFRFTENRGGGDLELAPMWCMYNTALHGDTTDLALMDGLYLRDVEKNSYRALGYYAYDDFYQFGLRMDLVNVRVKRFLDTILQKKEEVLDMIVRSYLSDASKRAYAELFLDRHERLSTSYAGLYTPIP
ncbi:MAG: HipA domain-containing protein [Sphingobacteriales bacterium]|jgi:serine/threonine-protein kinase HipA